MDAREIMTKSVVTATPNETVGDALRRLEDQSIRHLPVVEGERLVGMISDRDLREYRLPLMDELDNPDHADELLKTPLSEMMGGSVLALDAGESIAQAVDLMLEHGIGAVPVIDRHNEALVGIVSYVDVLRSIRPALDAD